MVLEFKLPDLGEGVAEGEIVKWLVSEGQDIKEDQPMVEVMTDKATVQIPSPTTGKVRQILAKEGQTVKVGTNLVILDHAEGAGPEQKAPAPDAKQESLQALSQVPEPRTEAVRRAVATPAVRKLSRDLGVEIERVEGTGPGGRISEDDVRRTASSNGQRQQVAVEERTVAPVITQVSGAREERVPLHGIRKRIAEKMMRSTTGTAAVTHIDEADFTEMVALREKAKQVAESRGVKMTFLPFIMKAVIATLRQFPYFNASIDDDRQEIVLKHYYNIGFAADTPNGLMVPVVKEADKKNLFQIAAEIERLSDAARTGKILLDDIQGGTFTVTNIGTLGGVMSTPIINVPEGAILGVHKIQKKPVVRDGQIVIRDIAFVALTFDHRIVDGADAARFTTSLIKFIESPGMLLLDIAS